MADAPRTDAPFADAARLAGELGKQWEQAMGTWWDQVLDSPEFLGAVGRSVSANSRGRGSYEQAVDQSLEHLHLPTRGDLVRLTRIAVQLEERLLQLEDKVLVLGDALGVAQERAESAEREALQARIAAAEARIAQHEQLAALEARIEQLSAPAGGDEQ